MRVIDLIGVVAVAGLTGCGGPTMSGSWESTEAVGSTHNSMELDELGTGTARIHIVHVVDGKSVTSPFVFEVTWEGDPDDLDRYEVEMDCIESPFGACDDDDSFDMDCRFNPEREELRCDGENNFRDYDALDWIKPPPS